MAGSKYSCEATCRFIIDGTAPALRSMWSHIGTNNLRGTVPSHHSSSHCGET